jgi:hypothetical protein
MKRSIKKYLKETKKRKKEITRFTNKKVHVEEMAKNIMFFFFNTCWHM